MSKDVYQNLAILRMRLQQENKKVGFGAIFADINNTLHHFK